MSKLFTFYNRAVENSDLVYVFHYDDNHYELMWSSTLFHGYVKPKEEIDAKVRSGEYEIVEDFRKPKPTTFDFYKDSSETLKYLTDRVATNKPSVKHIDIVSCPAFSATLALSKDNFRSTKEFKSVKELKEYVEALEKVFGNA